MHKEDVIDAYFDGMQDALWKYAHWKDGTQYIGNMGTTLKLAYEKIEAERERRLAELEEGDFQ